MIDAFMLYFAECYDRSGNDLSVSTGFSSTGSRMAGEVIMSWYSKVVWAEGLFLRPHHLQQSDRYLEHLVESRGSGTSRRTRGASPISRSTTT